MSRYRTLNISNLTEVEREVDFLINLIGERIPTDSEMNQVSKLISLANSLGTSRKW